MGREAVTFNKRQNKSLKLALDMNDTRKRFTLQLQEKRLWKSHEMKQEKQISVAQRKAIYTPRTHKRIWTCHT